MSGSTVAERTAGPGSGTAAGTVDEGPDGEDGPAGRPTWWRRNRGLVGLALLVVLGVVVAVLTVPRGQGEPLDPDNPAPEGARAVAQVLGRQGVTVTETDRLDEVLDAGPGTTVLVLGSGLLPPDRLREVRGTGAGLVLVQPPLPVLQVLAPELALAGRADDGVAAPGCEDPDAVAAGETRAGGTRYARSDGGAVPGVQAEVPSPTARVDVCYPDGGSGGDPGQGSYAVVDDPEQERRVVVHGQPDLLTNEWLAQEGNAALALRSLGRTEQLLWYRADPFDPALARPVDDPPSATELLPPQVRWLALQLVVVAAVAVLWRARRLGRLVPERLPAVVRSAETTEGRARLYRAAGARGAAARTLRRASARRLAARLATGPTSDPATVARLAAAAAGRDPVEVGLLLEGPAPTDDASLVRLADDLDRLEREVAHR